MGEGAGASVMERAAGIQAPIEYSHNGEIFRADSIEEAHKACPFLGKMSLQEAEMFAEMEAAGAEITANIEDAEIAPDQAEEPSGDYAKVGEAEAIASGQMEEADPDSGLARPNRSRMAAHEESRTRRLSNNNAAIRSRRFESKVGTDRVASTDAIVRKVIAANPKACKDFQDGKTGAINVLISQAMSYGRN